MKNSNFPLFRSFTKFNDLKNFLAEQDQELNMTTAEFIRISNAVSKGKEMDVLKITDYKKLEEIETILQVIEETLEENTEAPQEIASTNVEQQLEVADTTDDTTDDTNTDDIESNFVPLSLLPEIVRNKLVAHAVVDINLLTETEAALTLALLEATATTTT